MIDRQAPSMPNTGVSMRRIWLSLARNQGEETADGEQHIVVLAGGGHRSDQDLEQLVELGSRRDGDRDGSGDLGLFAGGGEILR